MSAANELRADNGRRALDAYMDDRAITGAARRTTTTPEGCAPWALRDYATDAITDILHALDARARECGETIDTLAVLDRARLHFTNERGEVDE
jgi:hypothetical protein